MLVKIKTNLNKPIKIIFQINKFNNNEI